MASDLATLLARVLELDEGATAGPWRACGHDRGGCKCGIVWAVPADRTEGGMLVMQAVKHDDDVPTDPERAPANALATATFRTLTPALARALREAVEALELVRCYSFEPNTVQRAEVAMAAIERIAGEADRG